ncbi:MAG: N-acetylmuramoyl-L-alanine amidase [Chitinispirillaceae bacterium]
MKTHLFRIPLLVCLLLWSHSLGSDVVIRTMPGGKSVSARSFEQDGRVFVSMTDFALQAGYKWRWNIFSGKLTFSHEDTRVSFVKGNSFYKVNDASFQLAVPPVRKWATMYLPVSQIIEIFGKHFKGSYSWSQKAGTVTINSTSPVMKVDYEVKQNGTVVFISTGDSLPFECTYFHPNLLVNLSGARVDVEKIRSGRKKGVIDSLFAVQFEKSAQISFLLNKKVEKPHVDFNDKTNTLMISLKPAKKVKKPAQEKKYQVDVPIIETVVIDPGHGGKDPGAIGPNNTLEKDIVLAVSLELEKKLKKAGLKVFLTREKDVFVPLAERTKFANEKKADLFLSIHTNAIAGNKRRKRSTKGYKIYFLSQAKNEEDKLVAMRENAVIELEEKPQNYSALQNILIDIAGNEYLKQSQELCIAMEQSLNSSVSRKIPKLHLGVGQANFWVLNGAYMPSVLVELGFISNPNEEKLLTNKKVQGEMAVALCEAIMKFKKQFETGL